MSVNFFSNLNKPIFNKNSFMWFIILFPRKSAIKFIEKNKKGNFKACELLIGLWKNL